jgi:hypothetical protein
MTAPVLLAYLCAALLFQLAIGISVALWRRSARMAVVRPVAPADARPTNGWTGWRDLRVARREFEDPAQTQCSLYLEPVDGAALPPFLPGQFLTFELKTGDSRTITRCYSLSDRPLSTGYRVTIKRLSSPAGRPGLPAGESSSYLHDRVREGDILRVKAPAGIFVIDPDATIPVVLIAGGIGITPLLSMLRWCATEQPQRSIELYYGVRNRLDHAFKTVLESLAASHPGFRLHVVYSQPTRDDLKGQDFEHEGLIDVDLLRRTLPARRHKSYVCGPPPMMASLLPALEAWGIPGDDIHHEAFGPASSRAAVSVPGPPGAEPIEVRFRRSGRTLVWQGEDANLLDFAERHGLVVESGCRAGGCGSCEVRVLAGAVRYAQKPDHDIAPGHCLLCIGTPASALEIEA